MKQHYVPRTYLRFFQDPGKEGFIWFYRRNHEPILVNIATVAIERDMYTFSTNRQPTLVVEETLARLEGEVTPILRRINESTRSLIMTAREREVLAWFTAYQFCRTPADRRTFHEIFLAMTEDIATALGAKFDKAAAAKDPDVQKLAMLASLERVQDLTNTLLGTRLEIRRSRERPFITSDYPATRVEPPSPDWPDFFEIFFPVGSKAALLWADQRTTPNQVLLTEGHVPSSFMTDNNVRISNLAGVRAAEQYLFACEKNDEIRDHFNASRIPDRFTVEELDL